MSEPLQPGLHPDPDSLNAFIEGALPDHERQQCLAHLAECPQCREVVFLAQEPHPVPLAEPIPAWRRWFAPLPILASAAAVCIAIVGGWLYLRRPPERPASQLVAEVKAPETQASPSPIVQTLPAEPKPAAPVRDLPAAQPPKGRAVPRSLPSQGPPTAKVANTASPSADAAAASAAINGVVRNSPVSPPPASPAKTSPAQPPELRIAGANPAGLAVRAASAPIKDSSGVSVTVTDASGGVVPGASVSLRQVDGAFTSASRTDANGEFHASGLPSGRYEVEIGAQGFRAAKKQIDVQPQEVASLKSQLDVASSAETVEVTASAPTAVQTEMSSVKAAKARTQALAAQAPRPLPSALPEKSAVTSGKTILKIDSAGAVLVSTNFGKSWAQVKPVWFGKVRTIELADPSARPKAAFRLVTDAGAIWLSRDGAHWLPAPAQR